jgi:hypothetical protein
MTGQSGGWANRWGVHICADQLGAGDDELRWLVAEEVAHFWFIREHGDGGDYTQELWATWFVSRFCDADWDPDDLDESSSYDLGHLVGGALAGSSAASQRLDRVHPGLKPILLDLVDHLEGIDEPVAFARALVDYKPTREDGAAVDALLEAYEKMNASPARFEP